MTSGTIDERCGAFGGGVGSGVGSRLPLETGLLSLDDGRAGAGTTPVMPSGSSVGLFCPCCCCCLSRSPAPPGRGLNADAAAAADAAFRQAPAISPLDRLVLIMGPNPGRVSSSGTGGGSGAGAASLAGAGVDAPLLGSEVLEGLFIPTGGSGLGDSDLVCSGVLGSTLTMAGGGVLRSFMLLASDEVRWLMESFRGDMRSELRGGGATACFGPWLISGGGTRSRS